MAAYHARTQFSGSQDGIVFLRCCACVLPLRANKEAGLSLVLVFWRTREQKRCGSASGQLSSVPWEQELLSLSACVRERGPRPGYGKASMSYSSTKNKTRSIGVLAPRVSPAPGARPPRARLIIARPLAPAQPPDKSCQRRRLDPSARLKRDV